ncbi:MAG TPA: BlaI/MecI/CopY family transcriptional regulator [Chthoniobacteraceae bacterium]|nr:BlaI/MecI/CopY family transcriptional regulator [Chthoniobacteraceae bacterium]
MSIDPRISSSEWEVLEVVWEKAPVTGSEVHAALAERTSWAQKTVNTFLSRLVEKGVLEVRREGRANRYAPRLTRDACVRKESESFLRRVFRGAAGPLLAHFCESADLSDEEVAQLQRLLKTSGKTPPDAAPLTGANRSNRSPNHPLP